jgi:hypothetical protein
MECRMDKRILPVLAITLLPLGAAPAAALDNAGGDQGGCICNCNLGDGWMNVGDLIYDMPAGGCSQLTNRTCNVEDPSQFNAVRTGRLYNCQPRITLEQTMVPGRLNGGLADPGTDVQILTQEVAPQLNGTFEQQ